MSNDQAPPQSAPRPWFGKAVALVAPAAVAAATAYLYCVTPTDNSLYPRCILHSLTGLNCPGCGATRAVHALLHGDLCQALAYNALFILLLPLFLALAVRVWWAALRARRVTGPRMPRSALRALLAVVIAFGILRNVGYYPFTLLAPHDLDNAAATGQPAEPAGPADPDNAGPVGATRPAVGDTRDPLPQAEQKRSGGGPHADGA
jgi:hypothetical protein